MSEKMFDFCIGNPPYQADAQNGDRANPVYNEFLDAAYETSSVAEFITPARFLFNAGQTPKEWNLKMLSDVHLKVLHYEPIATNIFPQTDIKGGVAITIHDDNKNYGAIKTFTVFNEMNSIIQKVNSIENNKPHLNSIIASQGLYRFSPVLFEEHPEIKKFIGGGTGNKIVSSVIEKMPSVFSDDQHGDVIRFLGRVKGKREYKYIERRYIEDNAYIETFNLFLPEANSSGKFGETLTLPTIGMPGDGAADTFLSAGQFETIEESQNMEAYLKTKFFRAMLGVKKVTQHCPPGVWEMIPLQDFTPSSDINWSKAIAEIDQQLYEKYNLSPEEIDFIEKNVKEMA